MRGWIVMALLVAGCQKASNPTVEPSETEPCEPMPEVPYDGVDQDCSGDDLVDVDADGVVGAEAGGGDCNDTNANIKPGAGDTVGDGTDQNCDGSDGIDADGDGVASTESLGEDCNDNDPAIHPGATEIWYDRIDQDCDRYCDYDADGDGAVYGLPSGVVDGSACDFYPGPGVVVAKDCLDDDPTVGEVVVGALVPADQEINAFAPAEVRITLGQEVPGATLSVSGPNGPVAGTLTYEEGDYVFTLDEPAGVGHYTATADWICDSLSWSFTAADVGPPVDVQSLVGTTYTIPLEDGLWSGSTSDSTVLLAFALPEELLLQVVEATDTELQLSIAMASSGAQATCLPTGDVAVDFTNNPVFSLDEMPFPFEVSGVEVDMSGEMEGMFGPDGLEAVTVAVWLDTRSWSLIVDPYGVDDGFICLAGPFLGSGLSCLACPDGTGDYCFDFTVEPLEGTPNPTPIVPRTRSEIDQDAVCDYLYY